MLKQRIPLPPHLGRNLPRTPRVPQEHLEQMAHSARRRIRLFELGPCVQQGEVVEHHEVPVLEVDGDGLLLGGEVQHVQGLELRGVELGEVFGAREGAEAREGAAEGLQEDAVFVVVQERHFVCFEGGVEAVRWVRRC